MRQGTTPTHTFTIPFDASMVAEARATYSVGGRIILRKETADCQMDGTTIRVQLTQEETLRFPAGHWFSAQLRVLTTTGDSLVSGVMREGVEACLDSEVLP